MITSLYREAKGWIPYGAILFLLMGGTGMPNNQQPENSLNKLTTASIAMAKEQGNKAKVNVNQNNFISKGQQQEVTKKIERLFDKVLQGPGKMTTMGCGQYGYS